VNKEFDVAAMVPRVRGVKAIGEDKHHLRLRAAPAADA
jgi:hypothetical protein